MEVSVQNLEQKKIGTCALSKAVFGLSPRSDILARVVRWQLAKRQAGTHASKGISDISGTTRKPHKQKGTGRARQGSLRSPQFRGGAVIFGPQPRSHAHKLPKKVRQLGLRMALSGKLTEERFLVLDRFSSSEGKTKALCEQLSFLQGRLLCITAEACEENFRRAASNIWRVNILSHKGVNVYDILRHDYVMVEKDAVSLIEGRLV